MPISSLQFTDRLQVVRRVSIADDGVVTVSNVAEAQLFETGIYARSSFGTRDSASPRDRGAQTIKFWKGFLGPFGAPLEAGSRLSSPTATFELLENPRDIGDVYEVAAMDVRQLYPFTGELQELGGETVNADVSFSAYRASERHATTGTYEDYTGEAPVEFRDELKQNRQLVLNARVFKIVGAEFDAVGAFVRMDLRRAGG